MAAVLVETHGPVTLLRFNRPAVLNAFNLQTRDELAEILSGLAHSRSCAAVILTGDERAFCAGADLTEFGTTERLPDARRVRTFRDVFRAVRELPQVTIAAMHGHVIGSGLEFALECDLRFAAENAVFRLPETSLGFIPAANATQTLARAVNRALALEMIIGGAVLDAAAALRRGLISRVEPVDRLLPVALQTAHLIARRPAAAASKRLLRLGALQ